MEQSIFEKFILVLPEIKEYHSPASKVYSFFKQVIRKEIERMFFEEKEKGTKLSPFGRLIFPYHKMGDIDSLDLFDIDEVIIFSFYWANRKRYKKVADIGANIGLHSILMDKCGFEVRDYEPDPKTFMVLKKYLALNKSKNVVTYNAAVSGKSGEMEFIRVVGNLTGSHLAGSKANPYGKLEKFNVKVEGILPIIEWADFIKMDAEGHEKEIILATKKENWDKTDAIIEVENEENAAVLFKHFNNMGINMFTQKSNWQKVKNAQDMPTSYREGSLFVTAKKAMPWQ